MRKNETLSTYAIVHTATALEFKAPLPRMCTCLLLLNTYLMRLNAAWYSSTFFL